MNHRYRNRLNMGSHGSNGNGRHYEDERDVPVKLSGVVYDSEKESRRRRRVVRPQTDNQQIYMDAIDACDVVFCLGPAGTGKTRLAAGMSAKYLLNEDVKRIVGVRPALEAGRSIGYLKGTLEDKIGPYLKPLMEELADFVGWEELRKMRLGEVPVVDLAAVGYLRGSNFKDSFIIFDEAQNATFEEMWMFLTRLCHGSKMVINGDPAQSDLPMGEQGALVHFANMFGHLDEVGVVTMTNDDIVRHPLVKKMMEIKGSTDSR